MKKVVAIASILICVASTWKASLWPSHFPKPLYQREIKEATAAKILLGRTLFYDPLLSADNTISCASCHSPYNAFAHTDHKLSHGIRDSMGTRNAPALFNLAWQPKLTWDGASHHLDMQALAPITHAGEMAESIENILKKLASSTTYPPLFQDAYGKDSITSQRILKALTQFQLTLVSSNAKYDRVKLNKDTFTSQEVLGYKLYQDNCRSCHAEPLFSMYSFKNNGLAPDTNNYDVGRYNVTNDQKDSFLFKIPSLRNLSYTYPYMHDGRFRKLREVLNHYTSTTLSKNNNLSDELKNGISLTSNDKADLIAFLLTLDDKAFIFNTDNNFPRVTLLPQE